MDFKVRNSFIRKGALSLLVSAVMFMCFFKAGSAECATSSDARNRVSPEFQIPALLRPRVSFWIDVFTKYGQHQKVVHHRLYPQIIFGVLDFSRDAAELGPVELSKRMVSEEDAAVSKVKETLLYLGEGNPPSTSLQQHIAKAMSIVRGGPEKYRDVVTNDLVRTQTGIKEKFVEAVKRSGRYLHFIEDIFVSEHGLPKEITRLPFIESTYNYEAVSSAGAAGLWQFMRETGKGFGMRINAVVDERKDPIIASRSAALYVKRAYDRLGNWPLAITSYNHGVTGVLRKMKEAGSDDLARVIESGPANPFGFASSNFWPEFLAAVEIYAHYDRYFPGLQPYEPLRLSERRLPVAMSVKAIARESGLDMEALRVANYGLSKQVWEGKSLVPAGYTLRVPQAYATLLAHASFTPVAKPPTAVVSSVYGGASYTVRKGDSILSIAKRYSTSVDNIVALNKLSSKSVKPGQLLLIKEPQSRKTEGKIEAVRTASRGAKAEPALQKSSGKSKASAKTGKSYVVAKNDTLASIAKKSGLSVDALKKQNKLKSDSLKPGQVLALS